MTRIALAGVWGGSSEGLLLAVPKRSPAAQRGDERWVRRAESAIRATQDQLQPDPAPLQGDWHLLADPFRSHRAIVIARIGYDSAPEHPPVDGNA